MKFTIEVEDFWLDSDSGLEPALKNHVIREVVNQINNQIKKKVEDHITTEVKKQVEEKFYVRMNQLIKEVIETEKIKSGYNNGELITIQQYLKQQFENNHGYRSPDSVIKDLASKFGNDLKARYDLLFASQLVAKLNENGMLKEDIAKLLLEQHKS